MAERLEGATLPPKRRKAKPAAGRAEQYPYGDWFDGAVWRLRRGDDFTVNPKSLRAAIHGAAKRRGVKVSTRIFGNVIMVQRVIPETTTPETPVTETTTANTTSTETPVRRRWAFWR